MPELKSIEVRGAREHNLKNIDVDIPRDELGGDHRAVGLGQVLARLRHDLCRGAAPLCRSLSAYARQFLDMMEKPDVDHISGLSPAISIEQKTTSKNPRSTVGTVTEIYDYLRLLFARAGTPYSPATGLPIEAQQVQDMVDRVMAMEEGTRAYLLAPIVRDRKGEYRKEFLELRKQGFQRVKVDGEFYELDAPPTLDKKFRHDIDVVVDRIVVREGLETRLADSFRTALDLADGIAVLETAPKEGEGDPERITFSAKTSPARSPASPSPRSSRACSPSTRPSAPAPPATGSGWSCSSTNAWWCPTRRSASATARIAPWRKGKSPYFLQTIEAIAKHYEFDPKAKWKDLPEAVQQVFLRGSGEEEIQFRYDEGGRVYQVTGLRGRDPQHGAPLPRDRQRLDPRGIRALPEQPPLRRLRRLPPAARGAGGEDRRTCTSGRWCRCRSARPMPGARTVPAHLLRRRRTRSPARSSRKSANGWASSTTSAWNT
jgi:excinuclease ABC subunit A